MLWVFTDCSLIALWPRKMKIDCSRQTWTGRTDEHRSAFIELLSEPKIRWKSSDCRMPYRPGRYLNDLFCRNLVWEQGFICWRVSLSAKILLVNRLTVWMLNSLLTSEGAPVSGEWDQVMTDTESGYASEEKERLPRKLLHSHCCYAMRCLIIQSNS